MEQVKFIEFEKTTPGVNELRGFIQNESTFASVEDDKEQLVPDQEFRLQYKHWESVCLSTTNLRLWVSSNEKC